MTDHKGLIHLVNQKNLSGRQACWIEKISGFDFKVEYVLGTENVLADALSRIYSNEAPGTVCARSEYTYHNVIDNNDLEIESITMPVYAGLEAMALSSNRVSCSIARVTRDTKAGGQDSQGTNVAGTKKQAQFGSKKCGSPKEGRSTQAQQKTRA